MRFACISTTLLVVELSTPCIATHVNARVRETKQKGKRKKARRVYAPEQPEDWALKVAVSTMWLAHAEPKKNKKICHCHAQSQSRVTCHAAPRLE